MATIEERAKEYALRDFPGRNRIKENILELTESAAEAGYISGATEQKATDIEAAYKACENELRRLRRILDDGVGIPATLMSVEESLSRIRMEMISST